MMIEINRFMTLEQVRAAYGLPESLAVKILALLTVAVVQDDGTLLYLESEVDHVIAEFVSRQRLAEGRANPPAKGRPGRRIETLEIAIYANELRRKGVIWKHVLKACREKWPDDDRVDNEDQIRKTWDRHFGPKHRESD
ncbi:MAG TPA: hypothetical protein VH592_10465 [Gemmataceae bacterium]|jgi:hypothetical protein